MTEAWQGGRRGKVRRGRTQGEVGPSWGRGRSVAGRERRQSEGVVKRVGRHGRRGKVEVGGWAR